MVTNEKQEYLSEGQLDEIVSKYVQKPVDESDRELKMMILRLVSDLRNCRAERDSLTEAVQRSYERARDHYSKKHVSGGRVKTNAVATCTWIAGDLDVLMSNLGIEHLTLDDCK